MFARWLVALAAASACGGQPRAPARGGEALSAIRIVGNHAIGSDALEPALALHESIGDAIDPYLLSLDTDRIRAAYVKRGFFGVAVTPAVEPRGAGQVVVFRIAEGRRAVSRVVIAGLPPEVAPGAARARVGLADGAPFDYDAYDAAKRPLTALLEDAGYARAEVRGAVDADPAGAVAVVRYDVAAGPRCAFGAVRITGSVEPELAEAARARLRVATGEPYSPSALAASQADIYQIGRFSSVRVVADRGGAGERIDVAVELVEANRHEAHGGFGIGIETASREARVLAGFSYVPAALPLIALAAEARVAAVFPDGVDLDKVEPRVRLLGSLQRIDLWRPRLRGELEGGLDYQRLEAYSWAGAHVRLGLASPLGVSWLQARIGWLLEGLTFTGIDERIAPRPDSETARQAREALGLEGDHLRGAYQASLVADLRDEPIEPHRGGYLAMTASVGTPLAGGDDLHHVQVASDLRGYLAFGELVVAVRARVGAIFGRSGQVPVTERYYSGGPGERGFSNRYLAPRVVLSSSGCSDTGLTPGSAADDRSPVPIGGAGLIETGVELRRPIVSLGSVLLGANLFLDGADVRCQLEDLDAENLHWAVGTGLWGKIYGLKIHTDFGYRLNRKSNRDLTGGPSAFWDEDFAWGLGIGETF